MKKKVLGLAIFWLACIGSVFGQVTGKAFLYGQTDHSGIKVKFIAQTPSSKTDSVYTSNDGLFSININPGYYIIEYQKTNFRSRLFFGGQSRLYSSNEILGSTTLFSEGSFLKGSIKGKLDGHSIYFVDSSITINSSDTLLMLSGSKIYFSANAHFEVAGTLLALGAQTDSVIIDSYDTYDNNFNSTTTWSGINIGSSSHIFLNYTKIGNAATMVTGKDGFNGEVHVSNSFLYNINTISRGEGKKIFSNNLIIGCFGVIQNSFTDFAEPSGIDTVRLYCNRIFLKAPPSGEYYYGGRLVKSRSAVLLIQNNIILGEGRFHNTVDYDMVADKLVVFSGNYISNFGTFIKWASSNGKVITTNNYFNVSMLSEVLRKRQIFTNNIVVGGKAELQTLVNVTATDLKLENNIFFPKAELLYAENYLGFGQKITTNSNGDSVDTYYNLFQDPQFVNGKPPFLAAGSPAIGAGVNEQGQPTNIGFDPTGTCLEGYFHREPEIVSPDTLSISGIVHQGAGYLQDGVLMAINKTNNQTKITRIKAGGAFKADSLSKGEYILYAIPNPSAASNYVPTFYINTVSMSQAVTLPLDWKITDVDIYLTNKTVASEGIAKINGRFSYADNNTDDTSATYSKNWFGISYAPSGPIAIQGNPCKTLPVQLYNGNNQLIQWALTDTDGYFRFENLAGGNYKVLGQRFGYVTENGGQIELASNEHAYPNLRLTRTFATSLDDENIGNNSMATAYPNPFKDELIISGFKGNVTVTNLTGSVYYSNPSFTQQAITTTDWPKGIYLLKTGDKVHKILKY